MNAFVPWWRVRSRREQRLLLALGAVALPVLLWLLVLRPIEDARAKAEADLATAMADLASIRALAPQFSATNAAQGGPLLPRVEAGMAAAGLAATSLDVTGQGRVTVRIAAARAQVLLRLVAGFEAEGLVVTGLSTSRNEDSSVSAVLTLAEPGA
jgi:general secretion pathway protein M